MIHLVPIHQLGDGCNFAWRLLQTRPASANISHKEMPSWDAHVDFYYDHPYQAWYAILADGVDGPVGAIYLTDGARPGHIGNEIGIAILEEHWRKGYGSAAVRLLMQNHGPGEYYANVSSQNYSSAAMFGALGFSAHQMTFKLKFSYEA